MDEQIDEITKEIIFLYESANPASDDFEVWENSGCPLSAVEELIAIRCHCNSTEETIGFFLPRYKVKAANRCAFIDSMKNILNFCSKSDNEIRDLFISKCATLHLLTYINISEGLFAYPSLPACAEPNTSLIDLASGFDFINFLPCVNKDSYYYAVDNSLFAVEVIRQKASALNLSNVQIVNKNVMDIDRVDFGSPKIEIIRAKNIFAYVPRYFYVFHVHIQWLSNGGKFIFAEQASEAAANKSFFHQLVVRNFYNLINQGWSFEFSLGDKSNPLALNNVVFTKCKNTNVAREVINLKIFYKELSAAYPELTEKLAAADELLHPTSTDMNQHG